MDSFRDLAELATEIAAGVQGGQILYVAGDVEIRIDAAEAATRFEVADPATGNFISVRTTDWIPSGPLLDGELAITPARGHEIRVIEGDTLRIFLVTHPDPKSPPYTEQHGLLRIHTMLHRKLAAE